MAKEKILAKDLAHVSVYVICIYIYIRIYIYSLAQWQEGRPWQPQTHDSDCCIFCSSHDIRAVGILLSMYGWLCETCSNLLYNIYRSIFLESLAKVLLKPLRKTAFT